MEVIVGIIVVAVTVLGYVLYRSMLGGSSGKGGSQRSVTLNKEKKIPMKLIKKEVNDMAQSQGEEIGSVLIAVNSYAQAANKQLETLHEANQVLSDYIHTFHRHLFFKVSYLFDYTFETFETEFADFCKKSVGHHVVVILYGHGGICKGLEHQHTLGARLFIPTLEQSFAKKCPNQCKYLLLDICRKTERDAYDPFVYQAHTQGILVVHSTLNFHRAERNLWSRLLAKNLRDVNATLDKVIDSVDGQIKLLHPGLQQVSDTQSKGAKGAPNFKLMANCANESVFRSLTENLRQGIEKANRDMAAIRPTDNDPVEMDTSLGNPAPNNPSNLPSAKEFPSGPEQTKTLCDNPHIQSLKGRVMNRYKILKPSESKVSVEYVQLALLEAQPYKHHEDEEEMMKLKKGGGKKLDFLERFRSCGLKSGEVRGFVDIADLLKPTSDPANRMKVVYGQAGIGKTTMLTYICRSLTLDKPMKSSYALVLYFPLRDKAVSSAKSLSDLLSYYASSKSLSAVEQAVEDSSDKEVLFIFDGADEVQDLLSSEERGVFQKLLEGHTLPQADVIVSSRPGGLPHLMEQNLPAVYYEIHGLPKLSIEKYIEDSFKSSPEKGEHLWKELQSRDDLMGAAHIPMNLLIFCSIFGNEGLPPTLTDCYKQFIVKVHNRESPKEKWKCFDRCPEDVKQLLDSLGRLAYNGLMSTPSTFVFEEEDVEEAFKTTSLDKSTFKGFLHKHKNISEVYCNNSTFNFSHTTQQELFCAYYISHLLVVEKQIEFLRGNCSNPKFSMVLRFYAGLTGLVDEQVVHTILHEPGFFDYPFLPKASTTGHSICALNYLRCNNDNPGLLNLFHFLYESQNSVLTQSVARHLDGKSILFYLFLTSYDTRVIAHCLRESHSFSHLGFLQPSIEPADSEHLLSCVSSILMSVTHIQELTLRLNRLTRTGGSLLILKEVLARTAVEVMDLDVNDHADMSAIAAVFEAPGLKTLELSMVDVDSVSDSDLEVAQSTARNIRIKKLQVNSFQPSLLLSVVKGLAANTCVEILYLRSARRDDGSVGQALATACTTNTTLKDIQLHDVSPFPLMEVLCSREVPLERLAIRWGDVDSVSDSDLEVAQSTARNIRIKELQVSSFQPSLLLSVVKGLAANTCVEKLDFLPNRLGFGCDDGSVGQALATACTTNTTLKDIGLNRVFPFPLMEVLCSRDVPLERLAVTWGDLDGNPSPCTPEALETLAQDMKVKRFESNWNWSAEDYKALADGLSRNKSLKEVVVNLWSGVPDYVKDYISAKLSTLETVNVY